MRYELILIPDSDDQNLASKANSYEDLFKMIKDLKLLSASHHVFNTEEERKAFIRGAEAMAGYNGDGFSFTRDTEEQTFRVTWRHEVFVKARDRDHAEAIWRNLDLSNLGIHEGDGDVVCHDHVEIDSILDEAGNDLLNQ